MGDLFQVNIQESTPTFITGKDASSPLLKVYPNPTNNLLAIETEKLGLHSINITSLNGQRIYSTKMKGTTQHIDLSAFHKGIYFINIRSRDFITTRKIIKL